MTEFERTTAATESLAWSAAAAGWVEPALLAIAPAYGVGPKAAERVVRDTVETAAERFRRVDGSYRFENRFRYLVAAVPKR